jgi:acetyl-CoA carboxylase biotin carboxyl carrier protein
MEGSGPEAIVRRGSRQSSLGGTPRLRNQEAHGVTDVEAHITGTVWKIECEVGDEIEEGDTVAILESMKMEMPVEAEDSGTVTAIRCEEGQAVNEGDTLVVLE